MTERNFEQQVSDRMEGYRVVPSPEVWTRVEAELRKRRRRRFLWWWLPGIVAGIGLSWFLAGSGTDTGGIKEDGIHSRCSSSNILIENLEALFPNLGGTGLCTRIFKDTEQHQRCTRSN